MINIDNNSKKKFTVRISLLLLWNRDYDLALFFVPANKFLNLSAATQTNTRLRVLLKTNICAHSSVCKCFIQISIWQGNEVSSSIGFFGIWLSNRDRFHVETLFASTSCTHMPCHTKPYHTMSYHTQSTIVPGNLRERTHFIQVDKLWYRHTMPLLKHNQLEVWIVVRSTHPDNLHHTLIVWHAIL